MLNEFELTLLDTCDEQIVIETVKKLDDHIDHLNDHIAELENRIREIDNRLDNI